MTALFLLSLSNCQETASSDTERSELLCKPIPVRIVQAAIHVGQELIQGLVQFDLVFWRLCTQQVVLVLRKAGFTGKHQTQHGSHDSPVILRRSVQ